MALVILGDDAALALLGLFLVRMDLPVVFLGMNADPAGQTSPVHWAFSRSQVARWPIQLPYLLKNKVTWQP